MIIEIEMSCETYLNAVRNRLGNFTDFGQERFTGFVIGRFFSITHHAGYEFNRRITNERNSAVGYVKKTDVGTEVHCIRLKGVTTPQGLITTFLLYFAMMLFIIMSESAGGSNVLTFLKVLGIGTGFSSVGTVLTALISALYDSLTERGRQGAKEMMALLLAPHDRFALLDD